MCGLAIKARNPEKAEYSPDDLLTSKDVCRMFGICDVTIWRRRRTLGFPKPTLSLGCSSLWRFEDLKRWQEERTARQKEKEAGTQP